MKFEFVAGNLALDFVATVAERRTSAVERVPDPPALAQWFVAAGVLDDAPAVTGDGYAEALRLRETLWSILTTSAGEPLSAEWTRTINAYAAGDIPAQRLDTDRSVRTMGDLASCLSLVARAAVEVFVPEHAGRLKWCEGTDCTRAFLDSSRAANRRWCGMANCGDRAKAAAYRARKHAR